jgi:hypothetical protein
MILDPKLRLLMTLIVVLTIHFSLNCTVAQEQGTVKKYHRHQIDNEHIEYNYFKVATFFMCSLGISDSVN